MNTVIRINDNKATSAKIKRLCAGGMTTGVSVFLASSAINLLMSEPTKSAKEIAQIAKRTGKLGLVLSGISALALVGTILCKNA